MESGDRQPWHDYELEQADHAIWQHLHSPQCEHRANEGAQLKLTCCNGHVTVIELPLSSLPACYIGCVRCSDHYTRRPHG